MVYSHNVYIVVDEVCLKKSVVLSLVALWMILVVSRAVFMKQM